MGQQRATDCVQAAFSPHQSATWEMTGFQRLEFPPCYKIAYGKAAPLIIIKHVAPTTAGNTAESARGITKDPGTAMASHGAFFCVLRTQTNCRTRCSFLRDSSLAYPPGPCYCMHPHHRNSIRQCVTPFNALKTCRSMRSCSLRGGGLPNTELTVEYRDCFGPQLAIRSCHSLLPLPPVRNLPYTSSTRSGARESPPGNMRRL
jgi:hypothetical protein